MSRVSFKDRLCANGSSNTAWILKPNLLVGRIYVKDDNVRV